MIATLSLAGAMVEGAVIQHADGVALIATGLPLRMFNHVLVEDDEATPAASEIGYRLYERLGYRTVAEYMGYVDPASIDDRAP